ncbi:hypothetical protein Taro_022817 [Colocasia esculenta]|uniref:Uncharacterized protein n=1 Tax=Colocasia esculenta TaxID=4460 RepID=A0A843V4R4_COLES|nr:hypothetical protein [Colocasia esculenta]
MADGVTDREGKYKIEVDGEHDDEICESVLVSSPKSVCATPLTGRDRSRVMLSHANVVVSNKSIANNLGFRRVAAMDSCSEIMRETQERSEKKVMRFMALSMYAPYVVTDNAMMVEYFIRGLRPELQTAIIPLMCRTVEEAAQRAATLERAVRTRQVGESGLGSFRLPQQLAGVSKSMTFLIWFWEFGRSKGNAGRSLHNLFFAKVVDAYRGYLSSWVPQVLLCGIPCEASAVRGRRTRVKHVTGLTGLDEAFRHISHGLNLYLWFLSVLRCLFFILFVFFGVFSF